MPRLIALGAALMLAAPAAAQSPLTRADTALVTRILLAEDRRDSTDLALREGGQHADPRIRAMVQRARGRIGEARFASRTALPALPAPPSYPEPAWRLRFRALTPASTCAALRAAAIDSAWPVQFRAADMAADARRACTSDAELAARFKAWIDDTPANTSERESGKQSWHLAAHAIRALARLDPAAARERLPRLRTHSQWQIRHYTVAAASTLADTATLRLLATDRNDNVREAAITSLSSLTRHAHDALYLAALKSNGAQLVRAAARALRDTSAALKSDVRTALESAFGKWVAQKNASAHDARTAILQALGRPVTDDQPPPLRVEAPPQLAALALGADVRLVVTISPKSGGGSFTVKLRGDVAPMMAARILALASNRYYDGLTWHRVEHDFVIQGGSPGASEYVGYRDFLRDELGTVPHVRGTVGMSTRGHDTGDAQWFVNLRDNLRLNTDYTIFGEVVNGIEVVDGILEGDVIQSIRVVR
jgi:cyclophilin family peptidyl-prolyl cis-trans isomerase